MLWGFIVARPSGRRSEHVEPSRPLETHVQVEFPRAHVQVKRMSDGSHVIYGILNVVNVVRQYLLGDGKVKIMSGC